MRGGWVPFFFQPGKGGGGNSFFFQGERGSPLREGLNTGQAKGEKRTREPMTHEITREAWASLLAHNPGWIVLRFSATWCAPCVRSRAWVHAHMARFPPTVQCLDVDVDTSASLYSMFLSKRMVRGVPVMLAFRQGNTTWIPDDSVSGSDTDQVSAFFDRIRASPIGSF
jgi:thiol:disulfide interchange protein